MITLVDISLVFVRSHAVSQAKPVPSISNFDPEFKYAHVNGNKLNFKFSSSLKNGYVHIVKNKVIPTSNNTYSDLHLKIMYKIPKEISDEESQFLKSYVESRKRRQML